MASKPTKNGTGKRKGRQPVEYVKDPDTDNPVDGLRFHKATGLYYRIDPKKPHEKRAKTVYYPKHGLAGVAYLRRAIFEHDCHVKGIDPAPTVTYIQTDNPIPVYDKGQVVDTVSVTMFDEAGNLKTVLPVQKSDLVRYFRDILLDPIQRKEWSTAMGIPEIAYLEKLRPSEHSLTLDKIGEDYLNKKPPLHPRYKRDAKKFWDEFKKLANVERVSELTEDHFRLYRETIYNDGDDKSPSYINNRFTAIVSVFRYAQTEGKDTDNLNNAVGYCRMLRKNCQGAVITGQ